MTMHADVGSITLTDAAVQKWPFEAYRRLQRESPVHLDPVTGIYVLTGYAAVRQATMDTARLSSRAGQISVREGPAADEVRRIYRDEGWQPVLTLVNNDPPDHTRFRALVEKAFTPSKVRALEAHIEQVVDELINGFIAEGEVEFMSRFGTQLPLIVFCDELGVPRADLPRFKHWSEVLLAQMDPLLTPEREIALTHEVCQLEQFLAARAEAYRAAPANNILSDLVHAEVNGQRLNMAELLSVIMQLVPAGHETTANAIGTGVLQLAQHPELAAELRAQPQLMMTFVEEVLRIDAPIQGLWRRAVSDLEIDGHTIPAGSTLFLAWGAANRDPRQFPDPDRIDLHRANARSHQSFGVGAHFCVGNALSRAEMRIAFSRCLSRLPNLRLAGPDAMEYPAHPFAHGPSRLMLAFDAGAAPQSSQ